MTMPDDKLISVIIPAYNSETSISDCINSISHQDYRKIEILVINDGSTDKTEKIVENLALSDDRIRLVNLENGGVSRARNKGISEARGEYIVFVDSDDLLLDHALYSLSDCAEANGADLVCASYILVNSETKKETPVRLGKRFGISREEAHRFFLTEGLNLSQPWGKLYKKDLFRNVNYPEGRIYEDISVIASIVENASLINISDIPVIRYRQNINSISQTMDIGKQANGLEARLENFSFYKENYPALTGLAADAVIYYGYYLLGKIAKSGVKRNRSCFDRTVSVIKDISLYSSGHNLYMKTAGMIFRISPLLFAHICRFISRVKNGL